MKTIALLFGSFNPIHKGHIAIADYTLQQALAQQVWIVVSPQNPLKSPSDLAPAEHRLAMARLATKGHHSIEVTDIELTMPHPSYTINTLLRLRELHPNHHFRVLAGSDIRKQLHSWHRWQEVEQIADFLIYPRGEHAENCSAEMLDAPVIDINSTACRQGIYPLQDKIKEALNPLVVDYIYANKLYIPKHMSLYNNALINYKNGNFGDALNDLIDALNLKADYAEAEKLKEHINTILSFRYTDIYNP